METTVGLQLGRQCSVRVPWAHKYFTEGNVGNVQYNILATSIPSASQIQAKPHHTVVENYTGRVLRSWNMAMFPQSLGMGCTLPKTIPSQIQQRETWWWRKDLWRWGDNVGAWFSFNFELGSVGRATAWNHEKWRISIKLMVKLCDFLQSLQSWLSNFCSSSWVHIHLFPLSFSFLSLALVSWILNWIFCFQKMSQNPSNPELYLPKSWKSWSWKSHS